MRKLKLIALFILLGSFFLFLFSFRAEATLKHRKETGKRCVFCHTRIPESGAEDPQLNEDGQKFEDNDYRLTVEQKE